MTDPRTPVLAGAGQVSGEPVEPLALMELAAREAAPAALLERVQLIGTLDAMSQPLDDAGALLAERIGARDARSVRSPLGGNGPQALVDDVCVRIAAGDVDVALIAGAEAMATWTKHLRAGEAVPWRKDGDPPVEEAMAGSSEPEWAAGMIAPIFYYPVLEHALRADAGRTREDHLRHISELWARFSEVAAGNPYAWSRERKTAEQLMGDEGGNRKVSDPYRKLHNSHIGVDQGAALLLCSAEAAAAVPRDEWIFPLASAQANDVWFVTERQDLHRSPALRAIGAALGGAYDHVDLYSCFPSAVQIAARELGLDLDRRLTQTGGLTFAGGPGNNYSTHGIATLAATLREDPEAVGLSTALGMYATKHAAGTYSATPGDGYRSHRLSGDDGPRRTVRAGYAGDAVVESYTALYEKDGAPGMGIVVGRVGEDRVVVKSHDPEVLAELTGAEDPLGRTVRVTAPEGFAFG